MPHASKIPCSVSTLTFNSEEGLEACLETLKDFAEVVVCDGNSTDRTVEIAKAFGAVVIKQYDTDEPETRCATDKAAVRARAMAASTLPWRFFMDSDDGLSSEVVEEIRGIVTNTDPTHLVWRMPTRIYLGGKTIGEGREITHEATYPAYQTRLVHESVGARFRGVVHDRLDFDTKKFSVGTMRHYYNFHWPDERVNNYWKYIGGYAVRELQTAQYTTLGNFLYWHQYKRLRTILGYLLWRLPAMYVKHGTRDSMPLSIELLIVRYHAKLFFGSMGGFLNSRVWFTILRETLKGKDLNRTLTNLAARDFEAYGRVLDVGGGDGSASYWRFMKTWRWFRKKTLDVVPTHQPDYVADLERERVPVDDGYFDTIMMMNVLEHLNKREVVLREMYRVLRPDGTLIGIIPFLVNVHPDPYDFARFTRQGLEELFKQAGFVHIEITPVGRGPIIASYYQSEFLWPRILKPFFLPIVFLLDQLVLYLRPALHEKFPLSYAFRLRK